MSLRVPVQQLDAALPLPAYARDGDAGLDLYAAETVTLAPGARALVPTGIALAIPPGFAGLVLPRSGLALRHGVTILNTPGLIDAGYRGERIAQLVIQRVEHVTLAPVSALTPSARGASGFGSTGV